MKSAVNGFLDKLAVNGDLPSNIKISVVPFSSRVNFGLPYKDWFKPCHNLPAVPDRWLNPSSVYSILFTLSKWIDNATWLAFNGKKLLLDGLFQTPS